MLSRKSKPPRNAVASSDGLVVLPHFPGLTEKLKWFFNYPQYTNCGKAN